MIWLSVLVLIIGLIVLNIGNSYSVPNFIADEFNSDPTMDADTFAQKWQERVDQGYLDKNDSGEYIYDRDGNLKPGETNARTGEVGGQPSSGNDEIYLDQPSQPASEPAPAASTSNKKQTTQEQPAKQQKVDEPVVVYSHNYDNITDMAKEAFIAFTSDGQPNSCYLNIKGTVSDNVITGKELNATRTGKEAGYINFVEIDDNGGYKNRYSWGFKDWNSDDSYELDLAVTYERMTEYMDTYKLEFAAGKASDNSIEFTFNTEMPEKEIHFYQNNGEEYKEVGRTVSDKDGYATFNPVELTTYIVSSEDILQTLNNGKKTEEAEVSEIDNTSEGEEIAETTKEDIESQIVDVPTTTTPEEEFDYDGLLTKILIILGSLAVIAVLVGGIYIYRRRRW